MQPPFRPELFHFLRQLKQHNDRDWFAEHKPEYEAEVREPALSFIKQFAPLLKQMSPHFSAIATPTRGSLFRIYRDIRFSENKNPYNTHVGIHFPHHKGKDVHAPLFYLHLEPGNCFAAAGVWHPETVALTQIRTAIVENTSEWRKLRKTIALDGEQLKRPPRGFDATHECAEDLKYKDFVSTTRLTEEQVCDPKFLSEFAIICRSKVPLVRFTARALALPY